jgi:hypothetical protein
MRTIIYFIILSLTLFACREQSKHLGESDIDFNDTVRRNIVKILPDGDSLVEYEEITFAQNDFTVPIDSFYYEVENAFPNEGENYRFYFDRQKVIKYCDSMLNALGHDSLHSIQDISIYSSISSFARLGFKETISISETHKLINRFRPFIINHETGHSPAYYFKIRRSSSLRADIERQFVSEKGDTLGLSWENVWMAH